MLWFTILPSLGVAPISVADSDRADAKEALGLEEEYVDSLSFESSKESRFIDGVGGALPKFNIFEGSKPAIRLARPELTDKRFTAVADVVTGASLAVAVVSAEGSASA